MPFFAVTRERGPAWDPERSLREQDGWDEHAAFMNELVEVGFIELGGPLGDGEQRFLLAVDAESEEQLRERLAEDPWTPAELLSIASVEPWEILLR